MFFIDEIENKIAKYKLLYSNNYLKFSIKVMLYILRQLFNYIFLRFFQKKNLGKNFKILFILKGGLGDFLISANFIKYFVDFINNKEIIVDLCYLRNNTIPKSIFTNKDIIQNVIRKKDLKQQIPQYSLVIELFRFPNVLFADYKKIKAFIPSLENIIKTYENFKQNNPHFFYNNADTLCNLYTLLTAKTRIQQADIGNLFGIQENYKLTIPILIDDINYLDKLNLLNKIFITINRGVDENNNLVDSTKLWNIENYNKLVSLIKQEFPSIKIIQLGASNKNSKQINNTDINLIEKTNIEELKVLLNNSILHIDCEGGLVHLRKVLTQKPSLVLFQSTNSNFYGYKNNINIQSQCCPFGCEHILKNWQSECLKGEKNYPCSVDIKPELVFNKIKEYLSENKLS